MKTYLLYGLGIAAACFAWTLIEDVSGLHGAHYNIGMYTTYVNSVISFCGLWLGIKAVRSASPDQSLTYGRGVGVGSAISAFSGLGSAVTTAIFLAYINPGFIDTILEFQKQKMAARGMGERQIESAEHMMRMFMGPLPSAIFACIGVFFFGLIFSLIIAAILKRAAPAPVPPPI